jgi:dienelactone hydrolase
LRFDWRDSVSLVRLGLAAIALHLFDDAFLQPEAGTSAGDHLLSGGATLALLGIVAALYPRLHAGLRGWLALAVGLVAIGAGTAVSGYQTMEGGPSGSDYTGLVATAGGILLAVVGVVTLWTARRTDGRWWWRAARRVAIGGAAVVVAFQLLYPVVYAYVITHLPRQSVAAADLGAPHEVVTITTEDGLDLAGWYVPSRNGAAVMIVHGRAKTIEHARMLVRHGYGVLLFDPRGRGESDGDPNMLGWDGERDLLAALDFLKQRPDVDPGRIGGLGLSVGGELLLQTAAHAEDLRAVVSEGAGVRSVREFAELPSSAKKWLMFPNVAALTGATALFTGDAPPANLAELVGQIAPRPVFLIYAGSAAQGGEELNEAYAAAAGESATRWRIDDGGHMDGLEVRPTEYEQRVIAFFDQALRYE